MQVARRHAAATLPAAVLPVLLALASCTAAGAGTVSGLARFEKRPVTDSGYGTSVFEPCRFSELEIVLDNGTVIGSGACDANGNYTVTIPDSGSQSVFLRVYASELHGNYNVLVLNNTTQLAQVTARTVSQTIATNLASTINLDITDASGAAPAFNIFDNGIKLFDQLRTLTGQVAPRLTFFWERGSSDGTYYKSSDNSLHIQGISSDPDEYDDDVILHETGHYVEANFSRDDSPGGNHSQSDSHQDLRVAWSEGAAYWWSGSVQNKSQQRDFTANGVSFFDMEIPTNGLIATGPDTEVSVEKTLWDIYDIGTTPSNTGMDDDCILLPDGLARTFAVLEHQFGAGHDTTLENFYNGWFAEEGATFQKVCLDQVVAKRSANFFRPNLFASTAVVPIPDNGPVVTSSISVPISIVLTQVSVFVDISHPSPTDLTVTVVHPDGTAVLLHNHATTPPGRDIFSWYEPFDATPAQPLSALNGKNGSGTWTLRVQDTVATNQGQLNKWRLSLLGQTNTPDLVVTSVTGPASAVPGGTVQVSCRIENHGTADASGNFTNAYVLSAGRTIDSSAVVLGTFTVNGLTAGTGVNDSRSLNVPANTTLGNYFIGMIADQGNAVPEANRADSSLTGGSLSVVSANTPPDLAVASVSAPLTVPQGGQMALGCRIENRGNTGVSTTFQNEYVLSASSLITTQGVGLAAFSISSLAAGAGFDDSRTVTLPAAVAQGSYFVGAIADTGNAVSESNKANNSLAASNVTQVTAPATPADLAMLRVIGPRTASVGSTVLVTVIYQNIGGSPVSTLFASGVFLSQTSQITQSAERLGTFSTNGMAVGQLITSVQTVLIPASVTPGTYFLGAILDIDNVVSESTKANNALADPGGLALSGPLGQPDLVVLDVFEPPSASVGSTILVSADVANNGGTAVTVPFLVRFLLSRTARPLAAAFHPVDVPLSGFAASSTQRISANLTLPATLPLGPYFVGVTADPTNVVTEVTKTNNSLASATPLTVTVPILPDLTPKALAIPASGFIGSKIVVTPLIANTGNGPSGQFRNEYLLSISQTDLSAAISLGTAVFPPVSAGQTVQTSVTLTIPGAIAQGQYHVALRVNSANDVHESNTANNLLVTTATVSLITPVLPELAVVSITAPSQVAVGDTATVQRTIKNQGTAPMTGAWSEAYVLSTSATLSVTASRLATFGNAPLAQGAVDTEARSFVIPAAVQPGSYFIGVIADPDGQVRQIDRSNNALAAALPTSITPSPLPELVLDFVSVPGTILASQSFQLTRRVRNSSTVGSVRGFSEVVYLSTTSQITTADTPIASFIGPALAPGASDTSTRTVTLPSNIPSGKFYVGIVLDPGDQVAQVTRAGNALAAASPSTVLANGVFPLLDAVSLSGPSSALAGGTIAVQRELENAGTGLVIGSFDELYVLSTDGSATTTAIHLGRFTDTGLGAGAVDTQSRTLTLPSTLPPGNYFLGLVLDPDHRVVEGRGARTSVVAPSTLAVGPVNGGTPDLAVTDVTSPLEIKLGSTANVTASLINQGTADVTTTFDVRFYLSSSQTVDAGSVLLASQSSAPLPEGNRTTLQSFLTIPANTAPGNYFIVAQIDPLNRVPDSNRANDIGASALVSITTTLHMVDLVAQSISFLPKTSTTKGRIALDWTVRNAGGAPSPPYRVQFFASTSTIIGPPAPLLLSVDLPTLPAGDSLTQLNVATLPASVTTGTYFIGMIVNGDHRVPESDFRNNTAIATGTLNVFNSFVVPTPDMEAHSVTAPPTSTVGGIVPVTFRLTNDGSQTNVATFTNQVYLSQAGPTGTAGELLDQFNVGSVSSFTVTTIMRPIHFPKVKPGDYYIVFRVDTTHVFPADADDNLDVTGTHIFLEGAPDLTITTFTAPSSLETNVPFPFQIVVSNVGEATAQGPLVTRLLLSYDTRVSPSNLVLQQTITSQDILAGSQVTIATTAVIPSFVTPGVFHLIAITNPDELVPEEDFTNDTAVLPVPVTIGGDANLKALSVSGPASVAAGGPSLLGVTLSVRNTGSATAPSNDAGFFLSLNRTSHVTDAFIGAATVPQLAPGQTVQVTAQFPIPSTFAAGSYFLIGKVDTGGIVAEQDSSPAGRTAVSAAPVVVIAATGNRPHVVKLSLSRPDPTAVPAGPLTLTALYDRPLVAPPSISIDQTGSNGLPPSTMAGSGRSWTFTYLVPIDNGTFDRDGPNRITISGGNDASGSIADTYVSAAAFVTDTISPVARVTFPPNGSLVGQTVLLQGKVSGAGSRVRVAISVDGGATQQATVSGGTFQATVSFTSDKPSVLVRAVDAAGNAGPDLLLSYLLDSDGDGMPDFWEKQYGFNPHDPSDASLDPDHDGLINVEEYRHGTNPLVYSTNGSGISDGEAVARGLDPLHAGNHPPLSRAIEGAASARLAGPRVAALDGTTSTDPDNDPLRYSWTQTDGPAQALLTGADTPLPSAIVRAAGTYHFQLVANDGKIDGPPASVAVTVVNVAPTASAGSERVVAVGTRVVLDGTASFDANDDPLSYAWTEGLGNPGLGLLSDASSAAPSITATRPGRYDFQLVVTDPGGLASPPAGVTLKVMDPADSILGPRADAGLNDTVNAGAHVTLDGHESVDPDDPALPVAYTWQQLSGPPGALTVNLQNRNGPTPSFDVLAPGLYTFQLTVTDADNGLTSDPATVAIRASSATNPMPLADAGRDLTVSLGQVALLDGTRSLTRGATPLAYHWTQSAGPAATLDLADQPIATFAPVAAGSYAFDLAVSAENVTSEKSRVRVQVLAASDVAQPVAAARLGAPGSTSSGENRVMIPAGGLTVTLDGSASFDPGGDALRYQWQQVSGPTVVLSSDSVAQPTFSPLISRVYSFLLTVSNAHLTATTTLDIVVDSVLNGVPRASVTSPPQVRTGSSVTLDGSSSSDPNGDALLYRWVQTGGLPVTAANTHSAKLVFTPPLAGTYAFTLYVDDGRDRSVGKTVRVVASDTLPSGGGSSSGSGPSGSSPAAAPAGGGGGAGCALDKDPRMGWCDFALLAAALAALLRRR